MRYDDRVQLPDTSRRITDSFHALVQVAASYHSPESFRRNLNTAIQALRNVTFILQSEKGVIPDFESWYGLKQEEMRHDPILRWLHDARNTVVKQEDLKKKSIAIIRCMNWEESVIDESEVDPFVPIEGMAMYFAKLYSNIPDQNLRRCVIEVEKRWTVPEFPDRELLELLAHCYTYLRNVVIEAHTRIGSAFSPPDANDLLTQAGDFRIARISPADGLFRTPRDIKMEITEATALKAKERYGEMHIPVPAHNPDMFSHLDAWLARPRAILQKDGHHVQLVLIYKDGKMIGMEGLAPEDQEDKYLMVRRLAERLKKQDADGLIAIYEVWEAPEERRADGSLIRAADSKKRREALILTAVHKDGRKETLRTPFRRNMLRRIVLEETAKTEFDPLWLSPVLDMWKKNQVSAT